jgi:hypothetical protein
MLATMGTVCHEIEPIGTVSLPVAQSYHYDLPNLFSSWLLIPSYQPSPIPGLASVISRLIDRTGWSNRRIADIVGTTHPTIQAIRGGREPERRPELADALYKTAEVVEKISKLSRGNQTTLNAILKNRGQTGYGQTPLQLLAAGEYAKAYLAAIDFLNKPRQSGGLLNVRQERQPSKDVGLIFDDPDD